MPYWLNSLYPTNPMSHFLIDLILIQKRRTGVTKEAGARRGPRTVAVAGAASEDAEAGERREEEA